MIGNNFKISITRRSTSEMPIEMNDETRGDVELN